MKASFLEQFKVHSKIEDTGKNFPYVLNPHMRVFSNRTVSHDFRADILKCPSSRNRPD